MQGDIDPVIAYYERSREEDRLVGGSGELEFLRTREILRRHLPPPPGRVLDVGGGTGVHAAWLLEDGFNVHLVDPAPRHIECALERLGAKGLTAELGDARELTQDDDSFDVVLLLGPLYHLQEATARIEALHESRRVAARGGLVVIAAISRFASLFDGLVRGFIFDPAFRAIVERDLRDGHHLNAEAREDWFTTAFLHLPHELADEVSAAGLSLVELVGVEGLAGWLPALEARWNDDVSREVLLDSARAVESEPTLAALSAHLIAVARAW